MNNPGEGGNTEERYNGRCLVSQCLGSSHHLVKRDAYPLYKMKIAFDHQTFVLQPHGGIPRYFVQLAQGLLDLGNEVGVFAPIYQNTYLPYLPGEIVHGRYVRRYPPKMARVFLKYNQYISRIQIAQWKPTLVHETYYSSIGSTPVGCPTVVTVHDMIHELFPREFSAKDETARNKRIAINRADHIICVSENTKIDLIRLCGTSPAKISVIYHGFDRFASNEAPSSHLTFEGKPFLLYVGQRAGYKNFSGLLKAVASSAKLMSDIDIVAFGGPKFSASELDLMSTLGYSRDQVRHIRGNDLELGRLYRSARAFVYPSLYEGFGIPPLEAMAHCCPVVSSNTSSMPEVIGNAGEYFDPTSTEDMCRAIEAVVFSDTHIQNLRSLGEKRLDLFSWNKCVKETQEIYRTLV